ncbi:kanadaptin [Aricia agestis]|uniref:kanadaptin n=1 Tax=Aricia agestis TaxID=91739 RepID=UPI001C20426A|nr:kanadaptin [Aricia agestis]
MAEENPGEITTEKVEFKKPVFIGRVGKLPKKVKTEKEISEVDNKQQTPEEHSSETAQHAAKELLTPCSYKEPKWSGVCPDGSDYGLEVLKSGIIMERIDLTKKPYYVFGRQPNSDVVMAHPTISRHHAVLQYKAFSEEGEVPSGWYIFDLGSTHGTFLNRDRIKERQYTRVRVGHQIKFGTSTRTYIVLGPDFDCEGESELTVTEIKKRASEMKLERDRLIKEAIEQREKAKLEEERKREEQGIDWGMGEDAEEEPDLAENPYASTGNEELYLDDPKKTLRGYFEREGHELVYNCEERGIGQFICKVELPIDDARGNPVIAEVIHKGKKKEAVIACALEACRILDRAGLLRQAKHESRKRKERDWSADDYYDSDEDTFLDRTGAVEKKRRARMEKHGVVVQESSKPLTYDDLLNKMAEIEKTITIEEKALERLRASNKSTAKTEEQVDALDEFMNSLASQKQSMSQKAEISKTKMNIQKLKAELAKTTRLAELARPADAPPLVKKQPNSVAIKQANSVVYGKRIKLKEDTEKRPKVKQVKQEEKEFVEEIDSDEETEQKEVKTEEISKDTTESNNMVSNIKKVDAKNNVKEDQKDSKTEEPKEKRIYGPMRPPENYVIPENYFDQETDRDLPEIEEKDNI